MKAHLTRGPEIVLGQFLEGINQASGAARLLVHHKQDTRWLNTVAILEAVHKMIVAECVDPMLKPKPKPESTKVII